MDAVWSDDFHHAIHALLTRESTGYYQDFDDPKLLTRALNEGYAFQGEHFKFWKDRRGTSAAGIPLPTNIICIQNHDQVGNRAKGERLSALVPRGAQKMMTAVLLLAPHTPLIFQGEEYAETFERSRLTWANEDRHHAMFHWYKKLLRIRREIVLKSERTCRAEWIDDRTLKMQVPAENPKLLLAAALECELRFDPGADWELLAESDEDRFAVRIWRRAVARKGTKTTHTAE